MTTSRIIGETKVAARNVPKIFPEMGGGGHLHIMTIHRWIMKGKQLRDGTVIKLEAIKLGTAWVTSHEAVARFVERLTADALGTDTTTEPAPIRTVAQRSRASAAANAELERLGA